MELDPDTRYKLDTMVDELVREYGDRFERAQIRKLVDDSAQRLCDAAVVNEFLPILAYRCSRERLAALERVEARPEGADLDIVFVSLSGGGRGQLAAALTALLCGGRVAVHSAGTAAEIRDIDPTVRTAIEELGVDTGEAFVRPASEEVLRAADVVVTMGHSVGAVELPENVRRVDWRIGDPQGADLDEVRRVRDDVERRVRALLEELGVEIVEPTHLQTA